MNSNITLTVHLWTRQMFFGVITVLKQRRTIWHLNVFYRILRVWRYNSLSAKSRKSYWRVFELKCNYLTCYSADRASVVQSTFKIANQCPFSSLLAYRVLLHGGDCIIWWLIDLTATRHRRLMESIFLRYIQTADRLDTSSGIVE